MLSYNTILAIQVLHLLNRADKEGLSISNIKYRAGLNAMSIGWVVRQFCKCGWLASGSKSRYIISTDLGSKTLYDVVIAMDKILVLGYHSNHHQVPFWGQAAKESIPHTVGFNEGIGRRLRDTLKSITVMELITKAETDKSMAHRKKRDRRPGDMLWNLNEKRQG